MLNDARGIDRILGLDFSIDGLAPGRYEVYTYAISVSTWTAFRRTRVTINQAIGTASLIQTGPMPGNALIDGITHTTHVANVSEGVLNVKIESLEQTGNAWLNGIQI